jgi:hypothetical protein
MPPTTVADMHWSFYDQTIVVLHLHLDVNSQAALARCEAHLKVGETCLIADGKARQSATCSACCDHSCSWNVLVPSWRVHWSFVTEGPHVVPPFLVLGICCSSRQ